MRHLFIVNPAAGKGQSVRMIPEIHKQMEGEKDTFQVRITAEAGHATRIAHEQAQEEDTRVYSIGGDGTLNEVLNGIADGKSSLAVIPAGSGNDFIRSLPYGNHLTDIIQRTIHGIERDIDIGSMNGKYFINIASAGLDAEIVMNARKLKKLPFISGYAAYLLSIFISIFGYKSPEMQVEMDDVSIRDRMLMIIMANGRYYGGGMQPAPGAVIDDGLLDVCVVRNVGKLKILRLFPRLIRGTHASIPQVSFHKTRRLSIQCDGEIAFNIDGEVERAQNAQVEIHARKLRVVVPQP